MKPRILVAGIGNIFFGDDAFGVRIAQLLLQRGTPPHVRVLDIGIRALDLAFALLEPYDLVILIDAARRGGSPGTLYTIQIRPDDIPSPGDDGMVVNSHSLDPVRLLALARSMGAKLENILLLACEPLILDRADTGHIGLSEPVDAALTSALDIIHNCFEHNCFESSSVHALIT